MLKDRQGSGTGPVWAKRERFVVMDKPKDNEVVEKSILAGDQFTSATGLLSEWMKHLQAVVRYKVIPVPYQRKIYREGKVYHFLW
jgi:hypothetical protein